MKLAATPGPKQYLAFDEIARRIREHPAGSCVGFLQWEPFWIWSPIDIIRRPNPTEMEWAMLRLSQNLNDVPPELEREQNVRIRELESHLDQDCDSLEHKYYNAIVANLHRVEKDDST